jgi:NAD-dependent dihydropyrimidine dehydrogenase PreA subunit
MEDDLKESILKRPMQLKAGDISPSKVLALDESIPRSQKVLTKSQVKEILSNANIIALDICTCRDMIKGCDADKDVCILTDSLARKQLNKGEVEEISLQQGLDILERTAKQGLVHLCMNTGDNTPEAICSCCSCCCHDLRALLEYDQIEMVLHSDYVIQYNPEECTSCGACVEACHFSAYSLEDKLVYTQSKCYGCGQCVRVCPSGAVELRAR